MKTHAAILAVGIIIGTVFSRGYISSGILLSLAGIIFLYLAFDLPQPPEPKP